MRETRTIRNLRDFVEALVRPLRVLVVDSDEESFPRVVNALAPYDAEIINCAGTTGECLQKNDPFDLVFVGAPLSTNSASQDIVEEIQQFCPDASVVIMARNPLDECVQKLMELGPFTFLKKNGSFNPEHVQKIANQLNLKLRPSGKAEAGTETPATASVTRV